MCVESTERERERIMCVESIERERERVEFKSKLKN